MSPQARERAFESAKNDLIRTIRDSQSEDNARFRAAVREGIAQANRGEFIEEEEMDALLERMLRQGRKGW